MEQNGKDATETLSADIDTLCLKIGEWLDLERAKHLSDVLCGTAEMTVADIGRIYSLARLGMAVAILRGSGKDKH